MFQKTNISCPANEEQKYYIFETVLKSNRKIVKKGKIYSYKHMTAHFSGLA